MPISGRLGDAAGPPLHWTSGAGAQDSPRVGLAPVARVVAVVVPGHDEPLCLLQPAWSELKHRIRNSLRHHALRGLGARRPGIFGGLGGAWIARPSGMDCAWRGRSGKPRCSGN